MDKFNSDKYKEYLLFCIEALEKDTNIVINKSDPKSNCLNIKEVHFPLETGVYDDLISDITEPISIGGKVYPKFDKKSKDKKSFTLNSFDKLKSCLIKKLHDELIFIKESMEKGLRIKTGNIKIVRNTGHCGYKEDIDIEFPSVSCSRNSDKSKFILSNCFKLCLSPNNILYLIPNFNKEICIKEIAPDIDNVYINSILQNGKLPFVSSIQIISNGEIVPQCHYDKYYSLMFINFLEAILSNKIQRISLILMGQDKNTDEYLIFPYECLHMDGYIFTCIEIQLDSSLIPFNVKTSDKFNHYGNVVNIIGTTAYYYCTKSVHKFIQMISQ